MTFEESVIWVLWFVLIIDVALLIVYFWVRSKGVDYWIHVWGWDEK